MTTYSAFFLDGNWIPASGDRLASLISPITEKQIGAIKLCSKSDVESAVESARRAGKTWSLVTVEARLQSLQRLCDAVSSRSAEFVRLLAEEIGCPVWMSEKVHIPMALNDFKHCIEGLKAISWSEPVGNAIVERFPIGVIAAITPWNAPLHQITAKVAAALAAGCTVVLKPSEVAPGVAYCFMEAVREAGLPSGVVNMVWGDGEIGAVLVSHPEVLCVSFTGSTAVGRRVMEQAAQRIARVSLELGGKSAAILLEDANLDAALPSVLQMSMGNSGQVCVGQSRLLVPNKLMKEVTGRLTALIDFWKIGDPFDLATRLGPLATQKQYQHVLGMIDRAVAAGARTLCGGSEQPRMVESGYYVKPTVLTEVVPDSEVAQTEVFGPVLSVISFDDIDDAIDISNSTVYGLSGAVWSGDIRAAAAVAKRLETGQVIINGAAQNLATPFGGWKQSGVGRENGRFGIEEFLQYRSVQGLV